jgi:hypothetical protein
MLKRDDYGDVEFGGTVESHDEPHPFDVIDPDYPESPWPSPEQINDDAAAGEWGVLGNPKSSSPPR